MNVIWERFRVGAFSGGSVFGWERFRVGAFSGGSVFGWDHSRPALIVP
jgi:hypothetical protein